MFNDGHGHPILNAIALILFKTSWGAMVFSLIPAGGGGGGLNFVKECFLYVILKLCAKFQFPTMLATGQKVCGVVVWWWCGGGL